MTPAQRALLTQVQRGTARYHVPRVRRELAALEGLKLVARTGVGVYRVTEAGEKKLAAAKV